MVNYTAVPSKHQVGYDQSEWPPQKIFVLVWVPSLRSPVSCINPPIAEDGEELHFCASYSCETMNSFLQHKGNSQIYFVLSCT